MSQDNNGTTQTEGFREEEAKSQVKTVSRKIAYIGGIVILAVGIAAGFALGSFFGPSPDTEQASTPDDGFEQVRPYLEEQLEQQREQELVRAHIDELRENADIEMSLEDVGDDPADTVAVVNGEEILLEEILVREAQQLRGLEAQGRDTDSQEVTDMMLAQRPNMLDNLIVTTLLEQQAEREGLSVTEDDIQSQIDQYVEQFGSREALDEQIDATGMSQQEFREMITQEQLFQKYLENYIEENMTEEDLEFTEEELRELYQQIQMQQQMQQQQQQQASQQ
ncbi:MAG: SurA N-terminal domain-containing protein, partial [Spirochaeta sp.]